MSKGKKWFKYYRITDAIDDVSFSFGAKEKSLAVMKVAGKGLFNTVLFTGRRVGDAAALLATAALEAKGISPGYRDESDDYLKTKLKDGKLSEKFAATEVLKERGYGKPED